MIRVSLRFHCQEFDGFCVPGQPNPELSTVAVSSCLTRFHCISRSHGSFFISHGFRDFKRIFFSQTLFSKKKSKCSTIPCQKILQHGPFFILDTETATKAALDMAVPRDYQKRYGKHPSSINLIKAAFLSRMIFAII